MKTPGLTPVCAQGRQLQKLSGMFSLTSLQSRYTIAPAAFHSLATRKTHLEAAVFVDDELQGSVRVKSPETSANSFIRQSTTSHTNVEKCGGNEGDFVET